MGRLSLTMRVARWKTTAPQAHIATGKPRHAVITRMQKWIHALSSPIRGKRCAQRASLTKPSTKEELNLLSACRLASRDVGGSGRFVAPSSFHGRGGHSAEAV